MNTSKRNRIFYWILTLLVLLPTAGSGFPELFAHGAKATIQSYTLLGYPLYLMKILGFSKILGAVAILSDRSRRVSEWAYAGFGILLLGATASHIFASDPTHAPIPFVFFILLGGSYVFWNRIKVQSAICRREDNRPAMRNPKVGFSSAIITDENGVSRY